MLFLVKIAKAEILQNATEETRKPDLHTFG